ncbi:MAG: glycosyltransferase [Flavobacteriaceae bacterium]|nr:glycosyltransferase [Flavobacteriaceae bacterium]MCI5087814.1 glycosyltransferase [Flavobacteriaceae bacterium]
MKKILFFTNIFPHYRFAIWKKLINSNQFIFNIYFSPTNPLNIPAPDLKNFFDDQEKTKLHFLKNYWLNKKVLIWQSEVLRLTAFSKFDYIMLLGEMYIISSWIACLIAKIRGKKIYMWSHGLYGNESFIKKHIRLNFLKLADVIFLYENRAKKLLVKNGFDESTLDVVYNSLDFDSHQKHYHNLKKEDSTKVKKLFKDESLPIILFIGRVTEKKKIDLLIKAIEKLNQTNISYNLLVVGDGDNLEFHKASSQKYIDSGWLHFYGKSYDTEETGQLIYNSDLCVSPGNIGLTAIHSLSYGTPVASHSNYSNQMPEVEAIIDGENGFLFEENDHFDLAYKINIWFSEKHKLNRDEIRKIVIEKYNPDNQLAIFTKRFLNG